MSGRSGAELKILIISHNCFSTHQSMGKTFLSLFSEFSKDEVCQLYIYPTVPDVDACSSYYRITDREALRGLCPWARIGGELDKSRIVPTEHSLFENQNDRAFYGQKQNSSAARRLMRDAVWKMSHWFNPSLRAWLEREKPTCIFLAPGYAKLIYDIALRISRYCGIPIVAYICDDYYFVQKPAGLMGRIQLRALRKKMDRTLYAAKALVTISCEAGERYGSYFGVPATTVMTGASWEPRTVGAESIATDGRQDLRLGYFGNVGGNRYKSLAEMGRELDRINEETGRRHELVIHTSVIPSEVAAELKTAHSIREEGSVTGEAFREAFVGMDLMVHTEPSDAEFADLVKDSVSTKIADSLASGIPLVAYGPKGIASMEHLIRNDCAFTATDSTQLGAVLRLALGDGEARYRVGQNAVKTAAEWHDSPKNSRLLRELLEKYQAQGGGKRE